MTRRSLLTVLLVGLLVMGSLTGTPVAAAAPTSALPHRPVAVAPAPAATIRVLPQGAVRAEGAGAVIAVRITCAVPQDRVRLWVTLPHVSTDGSTPLGTRWAPECTPEGRRHLVPVRTGGTTVLAAGPVDVRAELALCLDARACFTTVLGRAELTDRDDFDRPRRGYEGGYSTLMPKVRLAANSFSVEGRHAHRCHDSALEHSGQMLLTQRSPDGQIAEATGLLAAMPCDDTRHAVTTNVESMSPLRHGPAFVILNVFLCPPPPEERCGVHVVWREVAAVAKAQMAGARE